MITEATLEATGYRPGGNLPYGKWVPIEDLHPWQDNPSVRATDDVAYRELVDSLERHGQMSPVMVVRMAGESVIFDGNRRRRAALSLGWHSLWVTERGSGHPAILAAIVNSSCRPWRSQEVLLAASVVPEVLGAAPTAKGKKFRLMLSVLGPIFRPYIERFGVRGFDLSRRTARYLGWEIDDGSRRIAEYMLVSEEGVVRRLEEALKWQIDVERLGEIITNKDSLTPRW